LPDDHDVLQGNLWGEGGADMGKDPAATGGVDKTSGYVEPVELLNSIHKTQCGHHPSPYLKKPNTRGLSSYFGTLVYGGVGFAILADRQWKSGPERINVQVGSTGQDEEPTFVNPDFDRDDLQLLGIQQEEFLRTWSRDWEGHTLKAVLSQTVFAGISTHQPRPDRYLKYDFDSSGWPATARNRAIDAMRESMAIHICGDTHLGTLSQYGVEQQRDSNWAFCTPPIAAGWPRWWLPDDVGLPRQNRPQHGLDNTGEYRDSFGNCVYVYAVGNPEVSNSPNRYEMAHQKGSGFGLIVFDTVAKTYELNAYRFLINAQAKSDGNQFDGWPVTIRQSENKGENRLG
ncbi:MAG: twin-arginine translocation pathway signal, partial [Planctomycetota bacterium]